MTAVSIPNPTATPYSPIPCGPSRTIPFTLDWSATDVFTIDFSQAIDRKTIDSVQSLFVNNFSNSSALTIELASTEQELIVPALSLAYLPVITGKYPIFTFRSASALDQITKLLANNFPVPAEVWTP